MFYGWNITVAALLMQGMTVGVGTYLYSVMVVPIGAEFEASRFTMMLGITLATLLAGPMGPIAGILMDRLPLRRLCLIGVIALALMGVLLSGITAAWQFPVVYGLCIALANSFAGPVAAATLVSRWFVRNRGRALGIAALGTSIAGLLLPPLMQQMMDGMGWRSALQVLSLLVLAIMLPVVLFVMKDRPGDIGLLPDGDEPLPEATATEPVLPLSFKEVLRIPAFWIMGCSIGLLFGAYNGVLSNLAPYALDNGASTASAAGLISIVAICGMAGKILFGVLADRISLKWGLGSAQMLLAVTLLIYSTYPEQPWVLFATGLLGIAAGGMIPVWGAMIAKVFGTASYGTAMGFMNLVLMPFMVISAPTTGWLFDIRGDYVLAFQVLAAATAVGVLSLSFLRLPDTPYR